MDQQEAQKNQELEEKDKPLRKFEIQVLNEDIQDDGTIRYKPQHYDEPVVIQASTKEEFMEIVKNFKECGQQIKIIRELTPAKAVSQQPFSDNFSDNVGPAEQLKAKSVCPAPSPEVKQKPRIFKIGDIEVKDDNGVLYQKQWVTLTPKEAASIRIVLDSNNKIVDLKGKHIEMRRWIKVENVENDTDGLEGDL